MSERDDLLTLVRRRAGDRCEYCRMHQSLQGATFHLEHVVPSSRGGPTADANLALACPGCNLHKADRVDATDPETNEVVPLFHPHRDRWTDHFAWMDVTINGQTAVGRATVAASNLNHPRRQQIRRAEAMFDLFPPHD